MEDQETLKSSAVICQLPDPVENKVNNLLADCVVTPGVVVGGVLLPVDQLLRVEETAVGPHSGLVDDGGLQVDEDRPGDVFAGPGLAEECGEGVVPESLVAGHVAIRLDAVLQTVELPAGVADLTAGLPDVYRNTLSLKMRFPD